MPVALLQKLGRTLLPSTPQQESESAVADSQEWVVLVRTAVIVVGDSLAIGVGVEVVVGADLGSQVEFDTWPDMQPEWLVGAPGIVDAELLWQLSWEADLGSGRETFEIQKDQIALSDSLIVVLGPFLAIVMEHSAADSCSERSCSVEETASGSTVCVGATARAGCSDPLPGSRSARTSRHDRLQRARSGTRS